MLAFGLLEYSSMTYKTLKMTAVGSTETSQCVYLPAVQFNIPEDQSPCYGKVTNLHVASHVPHPIPISNSAQYSNCSIFALILNHQILHFPRT